MLTGAGGSFCSGMDLKAFLQGEVPSVEGRGFAGITIVPPEKPVVAAVEGYALASGLRDRVACDLTVAARDAEFGLPETKRSLVAGAGGLFRLPHASPAIAMEYALTGEFFRRGRQGLGSAQPAHRPGEALVGALEPARKITQSGPLAVRATKKIVRDGGDWPAEERWARQEEIMRPVMTSADAREGALAFAEKRAPVWSGK